MTTTRIHANKTPVRIHYIAEWAEKLGIERAEIIDKTGADKSLVSRWFSKGTLPGERYLKQLAAIFWEDPEDQDVARLFRDPEDDWIAQWFKKNRDPAKLQRVLRLMLEIDNEPSGRPVFVQQGVDASESRPTERGAGTRPRTERRVAK